MLLLRRVLRSITNTSFKYQIIKLKSRQYQNVNYKNQLQLMTTPHTTYVQNLKTFYYNNQEAVVNNKAKRMRSQNHSITTHSMCKWTLKATYSSKENSLLKPPQLSNNNKLQKWVKNLSSHKRKGKRSSLLNKRRRKRRIEGLLNPQSKNYYH